MSSSTFVIPPIPKLSINTLATFGERNAGNVGPKWIFLTPKCNNDNNTITAFCSYQAMLYDIGNLFISSNSNTYLSFSAITTNEYESLHCSVYYFVIVFSNLSLLH